jgi:hypothetical protein
MFKIVDRAVPTTIFSIFVVSVHDVSDSRAVNRNFRLIEQRNHYSDTVTDTLLLLSSIAGHAIIFKLFLV